MRIIMTPLEMDACEHFCANLVARYSPDELTAVPALVELCATTVQDLKPSKPLSISYDFGIDGETASLAVHVISATLALVHLAVTQHHLHRDLKFQNHLKHRWEQLLVQRGITPELAKSIPFKHLPEFIEVITTFHPEEQPTTKRDETPPSGAL